MTPKEKLKALREHLAKQLKAIEETTNKIHLINSNK